MRLWKCGKMLDKPGDRGRRPSFVRITTEDRRGRLKPPPGIPPGAFISYVPDCRNKLFYVIVYALVQCSLCFLFYWVMV